MDGHAAGDIPEAFNLLDTDHSGTIDMDELAASMPIIVPKSSPQMLLHYIRKADENNDHKLNLKEFTTFIKQGVGRDIAIGHV
ncbi:unnamed protein product [Rotaria magnacalcarata]|uniref:EF-hand domain-containing protein n=1 Tax=Rotaria magnacalcarata TaxID=392030 RepID=A0A819GZQ3_9BILA|nr:unnamed protein product [Rotaria magnacalcarata]CAF1931881.1 unnamed protein product [Rotaria magnacalcarata]CAF2113252.1 unnamed protein product [Rotaria magnacalcarata]CAF3779380.1 unnamed protein product [Rotaria magnacalcarata]CAF3895024.1 unnamed protein product [Rotaria magnacalcarata]